jgi:hypothetical protein
MEIAKTIDPETLCSELEAWIQTMLPLMEHGIRQSDADPLELVESFAPFLSDAKSAYSRCVITSNMNATVRLRSAIDIVLDVIERVYGYTTLLPSDGLGHLDGVEDLLVGLNIMLRRKGDIDTLQTDRHDVRLPAFAS